MNDMCLKYQPLGTALDLKGQEETNEIQVVSAEEPQRGILGLLQEPDRAECSTKMCKEEVLWEGKNLAKPIGVCCPTAETRKRLGALRGPADQ